MRIDQYGQFVYSELELLDAVMRPNSLTKGPFLLEDATHIDRANALLGHEIFIKYITNTESLAEFDKNNHKNWFIPKKYAEIDIAKYILNLCNSEDELKRCADELYLYQDRNLFDLLRYLVYLVDIMKKNNIIWGVGRGSSVASFILYKLQVHRVNSMQYNLSIDEFLR